MASSSSSSFSPADEQKIKALASRVVLDETKMVDVERANRAGQLALRLARKYTCEGPFIDAIMRGSPDTRCCRGRNDKINTGMKDCGGSRAIDFLLKMFRFPLLRHTVQYKSIPQCRHEFKHKNKNEVCLNPWHYRWVELEKNPVPPVLVSRELNYGDPPARTDDAFLDHVALEEMEFRAHPELYENELTTNVTIMGDEIKLLLDNYQISKETEETTGQPGPSSSSQAAPSHAPPPQPGAPYEDPMRDLPNQFSSLASTPRVPEEGPSSLASSTFSIVDAPPSNQVEEEWYRSGMSSPASNQASPAVFVSQPNGTLRLQQEEEERNRRDRDRTPDGRPNNSGVRPNNNAGVPRPPRPCYADGRPIEPIEPRPLYRSSAAEFSALMQKEAYHCIEYMEKPNWLRLMYYEEADRIGPTVEFRAQHCLIDGFASSYTQNDSAEERNRFSVGVLNNPKRSDTTKEVRRLIGKGIRFFLLAGEVYMENIGMIPVFVQSICANMKNKFNLKTVSKIPPNGSMKVFDMRTFSDALNEAAKKTYADVYALSHVCTIRISFCKGWGEHYRRSSVLRAPVWFQIHLNNPMMWVDSVLNCMGAPPRLCTSRT